MHPNQYANLKQTGVWLTLFPVTESNLIYVAPVVMFVMNCNRRYQRPNNMHSSMHKIIIYFSSTKHEVFKGGFL